MDKVYDTAVEYERFKSAGISIVTAILGLCFISSAISALMNSNNNKKDNQNDNNTPSTSDSGTSWLWLCGCGILLLVISGGLYYMATNKSKTTEHILAAQGALDAASTVSGLFTKRGGYFSIGE
jgi:amino acid permease